MNKNQSLIGIVILFTVVLGTYYFHSYKQKEAACLDRIEYISVNKYEIRYIGSIGATSKEFGTQQEAMNWCLSVLYK